MSQSLDVEKSFHRIINMILIRVIIRERTHGINNKCSISLQDTGHSFSNHFKMMIKRSCSMNHSYFYDHKF